MANEIVFIGDEVAAAGFRLTGATVRVPATGAETAVLREETGRSTLVLIARATAERVDPAELAQTLASPRPLVIVLPDAAGLPPAVDVAARVRLQLGIGQT